MPDEDLVRRVVRATQELAAESPDGDVDGNDVARVLGEDADSAGMHHAFKVAADRGLLHCQAWEGGMGLPSIVRV